MTPDEILEHCLNEIAAGRKTAAECAALYPEAPDLEAQLRAAQALRAWNAPTLRPEADRRIEARLREAVIAQRPARAARRTILRWALAALAGIAALALTSAVASAHSLPGETLYPVKRATEAVRLLFTPPSQQAAFHATLAQRRLDELVALAERGDADPARLASLAHEITAETDAALSAINQAAPEAQAYVLHIILEETARQQAVLQTLKDSAPPDAQAEVMGALEAAARNQAQAAERIEEDQGDEAPPPTETLTAATPTPAPIGQAETPATPAPTAAPSSVAPTHAPPTNAAPAPATSTEAPATSTPIPPGQARKTDPPPTHTSPAQIPPGQAKKTETATPNSGNAAPESGASNNPNNGSGSGDCHSQNPNSPNYCTPSPPPAAAPSSGSASAPPLATTPVPTPCPTNASGKPKCKP
jgi:hypothetical protein